MIKKPNIITETFLKEFDKKLDNNFDEVRDKIKKAIKESKTLTFKPTKESPKKIKTKTL